MGMYTQVRGWLNVDSISSEPVSKLEAILSKAQQDFKELGIARDWVCDDTHILPGGNGSKFIFIGTELKNYDDPATDWIKHLIKYFPNAEGRIDIQYEEEYAGSDMSRYLLIYQGEIVKEDHCDTWTHGYGNCFEYERKE